MFLSKEYLTKDNQFSEITPEVYGRTKNEIDAMRKRNPTAEIYQTEMVAIVDGVDTNPIFIRAMRQIKESLETNLFLSYRKEYGRR